MCSVGCGLDVRVNVTVIDLESRYKMTWFDVV